MSDDRTEGCIKCIDDMTDDLLEIADVLEEHQINVKLDNGRYLNPVSAIRSKVDVIWDEVQTMAAALRSGTCKNVSDDSFWFECSSCKHTCSIDYLGDGFGLPNYCPHCGRKVVDK